jgi:AraC-like DNA-binding protein
MQAARCRMAVERVLPDAAIEICVNLGAEGRHLYAGGTARRLAPRDAWVVGPHARTLLIEKAPVNCDVVAVRVRSADAGRVLGIPARDVRDSIVDLAEFWGVEAVRLRERLARTTDPDVRLTAIEEAVVVRAARNTATDHELARSLCRAMTALGDVPIFEIARRHGISHRRAIDVINRTIGLKPKEMQRVMRLRRVLDHIHAPRRPPWAGVAQVCGYFDQSHLIHDFRRMAGMTPAQYERDRSSVGRGFAPYLLAPAR